MDENFKQELTEIAQLVAQIEDYQRKNKIVTYKPIGNQEKFFRDRHPVRLVFGSNRSGKSVIGTLELISHALGYRPWLPEDDPDRIVRLANGQPIPVPNVGYHLVENLKISGTQVFIPKFEEWLPHKVATIKKNNLGQPVRVEYSNGSVLHVLSQEMGVSAMEGASGHYLSSDEPPRRDIWTALSRGLVDHSGNSWITATPIKASHFMADLMAQASDPKSDVGLISLSIDDNRKSRGGHLDDAAVDRFIASLPPHEIASRVYGKPAHLAGAVFKMFRPYEPFVIEPFDIPPNWPIVMGVDPAGRKPMAALWIAVAPDNTWYVFREMYSDSIVTVPQMADAIKSQEGWDRLVSGRYLPTPYMEPVVLRVIDTSGNVRERTSGLTITTMFAQEGLPFMPAKKAGYMESISAITDRLMYDTQPGAINGAPKLVFFNTCTRCVHEMMNFIWQPESAQGISTGADPVDKPLKANDDMIDIIRYFALLNVDYKGLVRMAQKLSRSID